MAASSLLRACAWIDARRDAFAVRSADGPQQVAELKALGELGHAADFLLRSTDPEASAIGRAWMDHCVAASERGALVQRMIADDRRYLLAATTYVPCHLAGFANRELVATVEAQMVGVDMPPFFWQMLVPTLQMYGILPPRARRDEAWQRGVLGNRPPDLATMGADAVYLFAHECLWAAHWGRKPPVYGSLIVAFVAEIVPVLIARYAALGHADLLAELVLVAHTQRLACAVPAAWDVLAAAQAPDGNIVPLEDTGSQYPRLAHSILPRTYHTTLVSIMAWAACSHAA